MDNFKIIGISTVTTNESMIDIENLWGKFWGENIADKIPKYFDGDKAEIETYISIID